MESTEFRKQIKFIVKFAQAHAKQRGREISAKFRCGEVLPYSKPTTTWPQMTWKHEF